MLRIKNVTCKNFMSVGNNTQAVTFENSQLTLVLGHNLDLGGDGSRNGTGKTTIINALSYALYGEALTNIKRDNLINKTNGKGMLTTVEFEVDGTDYKIERGRRPSVLTLSINGVDVNEDNEQQGDSRETQKTITKIIGFPHNMFKHLVALNTYSEPFLSMKAADQRDMIEQLLGITELSEKAEILKEKLKDTKDRVKEEEVRINAVKDSNERIEKNISELKKRSSIWETSKETKIIDLGSAILDLEKIDIDDEIVKLKALTHITELTTQMNTLKSEEARYLTSLGRSETRIKKLKADVKSAKDGVCPACEQSTAHLDTHEAYTKELEEKLQEEESYFKELEESAEEVQMQLQYLSIPPTPKVFYSTLEDALEHKHNLEMLRGQIEEKAAEDNPYVEQVTMLKETGLQEIDFSLMNDLTDLREHQEVLWKLLTNKDSFIRKRIIDQNIMYLNHRLAHYLEKLGLPHEVSFSSDLSTEITEYGRDLDFDNLSRGERNRLILGLSWAFRDMYESLNRPMNLLVIDELIDNGLDQSGVENALGILKKMCREQNKNIMLVSHREELQGRVNNILNVVKTGGFTEYDPDVELV